MLQIINLTRYETARTILLDPDGGQRWVVAIKGTFTLEGGRMAPAAVQEPVSRVPEYFGKVGESSLRRDAELVLDHPGTDVVVNASAHVPGQRPADQVVVAVKVGRVQKQLRVVGPRTWRRSVSGVVPSAPERFVRAPIRYEHAFGGAYVDDDGRIRPDPQNPVGSGYHRREQALLGTPAPMVEALDAPITSARHTSPPAGLGAIAPWWQPRARLAGTFDEDWQNTRMPRLPADYDPRFNLSAASGMACEGRLVGGEPVELRNLSESGILAFDLPNLRFFTTTRIGRQTLVSQAALDRVILEPDEQRLVMVWRAALDCGSQARRIIQTVVDEKPVRPK